MVVFSGILAALFLTSVLFVRITFLNAASSMRAVESVTAEAADLSAYEYAASRAPATVLPLAWTVDNRGGDWTYREGSAVSVDRSLNPSYSHGEGWIDQPGGAVGAFDPGTDIPGPDLDGDGAFSAWTGRLRGISGGFRTRFRLKVESAGSMIPLNTGFLDTLDTQRNNNAVQDYRDRAYLAHAGLAHALNNLGALTLPPGHPRRWSIPTSNPAEMVVYSALGTDLVYSRPPGGYRDAAHLKTVLASLGGGTFYPPVPGEDVWGVSAILPSVSFDSRPARKGWGPPWTHALPHYATWTPTVPVEIKTASPIVLKSIWRYLACKLYEECMGNKWDGAAAPARWDPRALTPIPYNSCGLALWPDEVDRLVDHVVRYRRTCRGAVAWQGLYRHLLENAKSADPVYDPAPGDGKIVRSISPMVGYGLGGFPVAMARYAQTKIDLAMGAVLPDAHPYPLASPMTWASWGIPKDTGRQDGLGNPILRQHPSQVWWREIGRIVFPSPEPGGSYFPAESAFREMWDPLVPLCMTSALPTSFSISAVGEGKGAQGRWSRIVSSASLGIEMLELSSQEDFENRMQGADLAGRGIGAVNDPWPGDASGGRREIRADPDSGLFSRHVASLPRWNLDSYPAGVAPLYPGYPRHYGALTLAGREAGTFGAVLYWPFSETDADTSAGFANLSATGYVRPWLGAAGKPLNPNLGVVTAGFTFMGPSFNPLQATDFRTNMSYPELCLKEATGGMPMLQAWTLIDRIAVEGWIAIGKVFFSSPPDPNMQPGFDLKSGPFFLKLFATLPDTVEDPCVRFEARMPGVTLQHVQPDDDATSRYHHFAVVARALAGGVELKLYIDGQLRDAGFNPLPQAAGGDETFHVNMLDDVRIHDTTIGDSGIQALYDGGRFARRGTYRSPRYTLDQPAELQFCQWTGMVPPSYRTASGSPVPGILVRVIGYTDPEGSAVAKELLLPGGSGDTHDLLQLGMPAGIRSFRYEVELDARDVAGALRDTPVLESIWFTFRRRAGVRWGALRR